jgi:hypothetical protein
LRPKLSPCSATAFWRSLSGWIEPTGCHGERQVGAERTEAGGGAVGLDRHAAYVNRANRQQLDGGVDDPQLSA